MSDGWGDVASHFFSLDGLQVIRRRSRITLTLTLWLALALALPWLCTQSKDSKWVHETVHCVGNANSVDTTQSHSLHTFSSNKA
jgi:hypothetical protein